jgi:FAD/FMN-containing dehydrogenase
VSIAFDLRALLGKDSYVVDDPEILISYQRDQAPFAKAEMPAAALIAKNIDEFSQVMKFANGLGIPVVTRGAGSGLAGGANAIKAFNAIISLAQSLGGTATGKHCIGNLKVNQSAEETSPRVLSLQRSMKATLNPQGILNPGKKFTLS